MDVFRCDFCGQYQPLSAALIYFVEDYVTDEDDTVHTVAIGCGSYCARQLAENASRIGGR